MARLRTAVVAAAAVAVLVVASVADAAASVRDVVDTIDKAVSGHYFCPPHGFHVKEDFNLTKYIGEDHPWYAQEQMAIRYLPTEYNYCTRAKYTTVDESTIAIHNQARIGSVNGELTAGELRGIIKHAEEPAKISVGPVRLPSFFYGPYWVIAAGPDDTDRYDWALVSGGPPRVPTGHGCRTYRHTTSNSGLWILTRVPSPDGSVVDNVRDLAREIGFDVSVLNKVQQMGCLYDDAK